jgi:hypothetical protein
VSRPGSRSIAFAVAGLALAAAACNPTLMGRSTAPPGRSARLDEVHGFWGIKSYRLELSVGVAFALSCHKGGPCEKMVIVSDDPAVAEVRTASLAQLEPSNAYNQATTSAAVIIGKAPGTTHVLVRSKGGHRDIAVTVVPAPGYGTPVTAVSTLTSTPPAR